MTTPDGRAQLRAPAAGTPPARAAAVLDEAHLGDIEGACAPARKAALLAMYGYLVISVLLLIVKAVQLAR